MEKIQAAIAKARAIREEAEATSGPAAPEAGPVTGPQDTPQAEHHAGSEIARRPPAAAWRALTAFEPDPAHMLRSRVVSFASGTDALPFDVIRTRMLRQMRASGWLRVGIASPGAGCGKSVLALNLAFSLARQSEQRTVLIEVDLRRPSLARYLGLNAGHKVASVLEGKAVFSDHAVRCGANLAIATQSGPAISPAELLHSPATTDALAEIARDYEPSVMLFDLPSLQAGDDVMAFIGNLDAVLIVAGAEMTTIKQIDQCERELATQCSVMGVVLNKCRHFDDLSRYDYAR